MKFPVGSLVKARGREWVVLPESGEDLLVLRPLGGTDEEKAGIYIPLERVEEARFDLPDPRFVGDHNSCRLLRDAVRLSLRSCTGPFRSFARLAVNPRPYQLVPLLMALKLDPVRLLIADDVGIGKTIEACLVGRELLDRGEVRRIAVLCPPHLAEQWQGELSEKFHIEAELVLPSTAARLERHCRVDQSLFEIYPYVVVSMDFIKSDRRRDEFARNCPELVFVDEAHTCAFGYRGRGGRHQRHQLVKLLAQNPRRHLILVTATPHSGNEEAFRSLLSFLSPDFASLPDDLIGPEKEPLRRRLAAQFIQRRRADIRRFLQTDTAFPRREEAEVHYVFSAAYRAFFDRVLRCTREIIQDPEGGRYRQRVRWWSALALLRSVGSSPAAAASTLRERSRAADSADEKEADETGRRIVLDLETEDQTEGTDLVPGAGTGEETEEEKRLRRRLQEMAREAEKLKGKEDAKLVKAADLVEDFLASGYRPILFCRFIPTAEYVAEELRSRLPGRVEVAAVTGLLAPAERAQRVEELARAEKRVLVCTECLSEGINLQDHFDAVMHYDLSWNPTRHEQRAGRVDRFGQKKGTVRVLTYYGKDSPIDGFVLDVLLRKHKSIRTSTGICVPVPLDTDAVIEAIFEGLLLRKGKTEAALLPGMEEYLRPKKEDLHAKWDEAADREKRSRTLFSQQSIKVDEVARELQDVRKAAGGAGDISAFVKNAMRGLQAAVKEDHKSKTILFSKVPAVLRDRLRLGEEKGDSIKVPAENGNLAVHRTHPLVEGLASYVLDTALDPLAGGIARRAGAIRTAAVKRRATLLLVRFRYDISTRREEGKESRLAEECILLAFEGAPGEAVWLNEEAAEALLEAEPSGNITEEQKVEFVRRVADGFDSLRPRLEEVAFARAERLRDAHNRVRTASRMRGIVFEVKPQLPPDVLGIYVFLPSVSGGKEP